MQATWIVVAHRAGARVFEFRGASNPLALVEEVVHDAGRRKSGEIDSDRPGLSFSKGGTGGGHPMNKEVSAHDHVAHEFAHEITEWLRAERVGNRFAHLVLVAEPRFLGMLTGALDPVTAATVIAKLPKDLARVTARELPRHLDGVALH